LRNKSSCQKITDRVFEVMKENLINHTSLVRVMAGKKLNINDKKELIKILKKNDVEKAGLFGSYARGDAREDSDIDILIKFRGRKSLLDLAGLKIDLEEKLKKKVDVITYDSIHPLIKENILKEQVRVL